MKKRFRRITSTLLSAALMFGCVGFSASAEQSNLSPDEQYIAMMEATDWGLYDNHAINVQRAQIPDYLLNQMTTEQLVNAVLHYPYLIDIMAYDSYEMAFKDVSQHFNGLLELLVREDGAQKLLERMQQISIPGDIVTTHSTNVDPQAHLEIMFLGILSAQPEFLNQLDQEEYDELIQTVDEKAEEKLASPNYGQAEAYLFYTVANEQISTYADRTPYTITTPSGRTVSVLKWNPESPDMSQTTKDNLRNEYLRKYPNSILRREASYKYNCHSYAWYSQSWGNDI